MPDAGIRASNMAPFLTQNTLRIISLSAMISTASGHGEFAASVSAHCRLQPRIAKTSWSRPPRHRRGALRVYPSLMRFLHLGSASIGRFTYHRTHDRIERKSSSVRYRGIATAARHHYMTHSRFPAEARSSPATCAAH